MRYFFRIQILVCLLLVCRVGLAQTDNQKLYDDRYLFSKGKKLGVKTAKGKTILPAKYDEIELIETDYYNATPVFVASLDTRRGLYSFSGKELLPHVYDAIGREQNFLVLRIDDKTGACDSTGHILLEPGKYDKVNFLRNANHWLVTKDNKKAIINSKGEELTGFNIASIGLFPNTHEYFCFLFETYEGKTGAIGLWQELGVFYSKFIPPVFKSAEFFEFEGPPGTSFSTLSFSDGKQHFWYSSVADTIVADSLDEAYPCMSYQGLQNHRIIVTRRNGKTGILGAAEGEVIIPYILDDAFPSTDVYLMAGINNKYGIIDLYDLLQEDNSIDPEEFVLSKPLPFHFVMEVSGSEHEDDIHFVVGTPYGYMMINFRGDTLVNDVFENISFDDCLEYFLTVEKNGQKGVYSLRGKNVIPVAYDEIEAVYIDETVYFIVKTGKKAGLYNPEGKMLLEARYSDIKLVMKDNVLFDAFVGKRLKASVQINETVIQVH